MLSGNNFMFLQLNDSCILFDVPLVNLAPFFLPNKRLPENKKKKNQYSSYRQGIKLMSGLFYYKATVKLWGHTAVQQVGVILLTSILYFGSI